MKNMKLIVLTMIALGGISGRMNASDFLKSLNSWYKCGNSEAEVVDNRCGELNDLKATVRQASNPLKRLIHEDPGTTLALTKTKTNGHFTIEKFDLPGGLSLEAKVFLSKLLFENLLKENASIQVTGNANHMEIIEVDYLDRFNVEEVPQKTSLFGRNNETKTIKLSLKSQTSK